MSAYNDARDFCLKFRIPMNNEPGSIDPGLMYQRLGLIREEVIELEGHMDQLALDPHNLEELEGTLDAMVDLVYSTLATAAQFGFDFEEAWKRVHAANMNKQRAAGVDNKRQSAYDVVKPKDWQPPELSDLVVRTNHTARELLCLMTGSDFASSSAVEPTTPSTAVPEKSSAA